MLRSMIVMRIKIITKIILCNPPMLITILQINPISNSSNNTQTLIIITITQTITIIPTIVITILQKDLISLKITPPSITKPNHILISTIIINKLTLHLFSTNHNLLISYNQNNNK